MSSVTDRYKTALIEEHESYVRSGRTKDAAQVAKVLKEQHDYDVSDHDDPKDKGRLAATLPETVEAEKPAENAAEPRPRRGGSRANKAQDESK